MRAQQRLELRLRIQRGLAIDRVVELVLALVIGNVLVQFFEVRRVGPPAETVGRRPNPNSVPRRVRGGRADHGPGRVARERANRPAVLRVLVVVARPRQTVAALEFFKK